MIDLKKYEFNTNEKIILYFAIVLGGIFVSLLLFKNIFFAVIIVPFIKSIKRNIKDYLILKRKKSYIIQFKDFLFMTSTSIGAGRSMTDAISESIPSLIKIYGEEAILPMELKKIKERLTVGMEEDVDVLQDMAEMSGIEDVYDFVTIYSICKKTGASLIVALRKAANVIIEKISIEREIEELKLRKKKEGALIFSMPIMIIIFLNLTAPDYISPLYETVVGRVIMSIVFISTIGIYALIRKITEVEI